MVVQHNLTAMNANRYFGINNKKLSKSLEKLSSGYSINRAGDNAAGLAVSEKMRSQIAGMTQAVKNAQDGISMVQTYEGALTETDSILQRMKTLANQMANGSYDDPVDRTAAQQEFLQLNDELDQIADTDFNGVTVLNGGVMADGTCAEGVTAEFDAAGHVISKTAAKDYKGGIIDYTQADKSEEAKAELTQLQKYDGKTDDYSTARTTAAEVGTLNAYNYTGDEEITVTYAYAGNGKWVNDYNDDTITANETGGFTGLFGDTITLDSQGLEEGDTVSVKYTPGKDSVSLVSATADAVAEVDAAATDTSIDGSGSFKLADSLKNQKMSAELAAALEALDDVEIEITTVGNEKDGYPATVTVTGATVGASTNIPTGTDTKELYYVYDKDKGTVTFYGNTTGKAGAPGTDGIVELGTLTLDKITSAKANEKVTYDLQVQTAAYEPAEKGKVAIDDTAVYDEQKLLEKINKLGNDDSYAVSKSNAFGQSKTKMSYTNNITLQVGARTKDAVNFTFEYASTAIGDLNPDLDCTSYGLGTSKLNLSSQEAANDAIDKIDQAINKVSLVRGTFGAIQNRLDHKIDNLNVSVENLTSAESQIRDTNMAEEMMNFTKQQILSQASQSMLAQANQLPQSVLQLLQ